MRNDLVGNVFCGANKDERGVVDESTIDPGEARKRVQGRLPVVGDLQQLHERFHDRKVPANRTCSNVRNGIIDLAMRPLRDVSVAV